MNSSDVERKVSLHVVPTPIGNLGDITLRGIETLKKADAILAEDTRTTGILLKHHQISKPLHSFHIFNEHRVLDKLVEEMKAGKTFALVSDAGTPGIADPGFLLVRACLQAGLSVECLPGPSALLPALVQSGFPTDRFVFEGFLPHKKGKNTILQLLAQEERTIVFYESPHRLLKTLEQMLPYFGSTRMVSISRELTKLHEETFTAPLEEVIAHFHEKEVKGEIVVVVDGKRN